MSTQSDIVPLLIAAGLRLHVTSHNNKAGRNVVLTEKLYREDPSLISDGEVITGVTIPSSDKVFYGQQSSALSRFFTGALTIFYQQLGFFL